MVDVVGKPIYRANTDGTFTQKVSVAQLKPSALSNAVSSAFDGDKFFGGFGPTQIQWTDYWTLRQRSAQLFNENLYARGLIRRLVTNEINTGLTPEATPDEEILGVADDSLADWTETVENRFGIYAQGKKLCDWKQQSTFGAIQRTARMEALIEGDVLVVLRQSQRTGLPQIQLVSGSKVRTPLIGEIKLRAGNEIKHGVEFDSSGRVVAHWIATGVLSESKRIPAFGEKSGRKLSWLVYGTDKRMDEVRGQPILSLVLQSLKEIDRYRDSTQRKAVINSILAMFIEKGEDKMGTLPVTGGAVRKDTYTATNNNNGEARDFNIAGQIPGMVMQELQHGEKPVAFGSQGTDTNFGTFESAILQTVAWANEIPPEILTLAFSNNYSASQAAINEFKIYLNKVWSEFGEDFCGPIFTEWMLSEVLMGKIEAPGLLEAWRTPSQYDAFGAWTSVEWYGSIKPSTDMLKQVKASELFVAGGYSTRAREARVNTGTKFSKNVKRAKRENAQLAESLRPMLELNKEFGPQEVEKVTSASVVADNVVAIVAEVLEDQANN